MVQLTLFHMIGIILTLLVIMALGIHTGKRIKNASDFSTGGRSASTTIVTGALISTLIGGASTIGTAELAFTNGMSAWWFTLGTGIGCLLFGLIFVKPIRYSNCNTIQQIISKEYGTVSGIVTSILNIFGIILNIVTQMLAANALLTTMFSISPTLCAFITVIIMICYVVFGGVLGTGVLGIIKLVLIYIAIIFGTWKIFNLNGGIFAIYNSLPHEQYFNMLSRGVGNEVGAAISVVLGVICGQTYVQIILSGKSNKEARTATIISAAMLPPVGLGGVLIGMYMKVNYPFINPSQAFPLFIMEHMPPVLGGATLAILLIALVGTGSGMALGMGTIITNDIYLKFINKNADSKKELLVNRIIIILAFIVSAIFTSGNLHSSVLTWGFLATGLRGTVLLIPMLGALFLKGKIDSRFAVASSALGVAAHLTGELFMDLNFDPLFLGIGVSIAVAILGAFVKTYNKNDINLLTH